MVLDSLKEEDFAVLRGPFESGRQSPDHLGWVLLLAVVLGGGLYALIYFVLGYDSEFSLKMPFLYIHLGITGVICILCFIYGIKSIYKNQQIMQYIVSILFIQNIGLLFFVAPLFIFSNNVVFYDTGNTVITIAITNIVVGILVFVVTWIRFMRLLRKGAYRPGSKRGQLRGKFEKGSYIPLVIVASTGVVLMICHFVDTFSLQDLETISMAILAILLFYTMIFVLPEQIVLVYCKRRFKSFNFDKEGNLYPLGSGDRLN